VPDGLLAILLERFVRRFLLCLVSLVCCGSIASADRPIFLVTPAGVYQSIVSDAGVPGPWEKISADVIVTGFGGNVPDTPKPIPDAPKPEPPADPVVSQIAAISTRVLQDADEATAVGAIIDTIAKMGLPPDEFRQAIEMTTPILDKSLDSGGRLTEWMKQALFVTADPKKMKAGLAFAFGIQQSKLDSIHDAATNPEAVATGEALNFARLIAILQTVLTVLKMLGIGNR